jgi:glycine betaine catabolism B
MRMHTAPLWSVDTDDVLWCEQIRQETHDVKTFVLRPATPRRFAYLPGQFITLSVPAGPGGAMLQRSYTLSSSPTRPDRLSITVKRVPGGPVSGWLHEQLRPGMALEVQGPLGEFSCFADGEVAQPLRLSAPSAAVGAAAGSGADAGDAPPCYLFISAGSGITPLMSMTRTLVDLGTSADIVFVHAARSPDDLIFEDELALLARQHPKLKLGVVVEGVGRRPQWPGPLGRLDLPLLQRLVPDLLQRDVYTCGPAPFMAQVRGLLQQAGHAPTQYREESFRFEDLAASAPVDAQAEPEATPQGRASMSEEDGFQITLSKFGDTFTCGSHQSLLAAATAAGLRMPASCSTGLCGTCKTRKVSGEVVMQHKGGIRPREIEQGWILPCCSTPLSDVVLDR